MTIFDLITWTIGTVIGLCTIAGLAVKFVLLPYVKEHVVAPVKQTEKQVTENHHSNAEPTVLDRLSDLRKDINAARAEAHQENAAVRAEVRALARMQEGHVGWSEGWTERIEADLDNLKKQQRRRRILGVFR